MKVFQISEMVDRLFFENHKNEIFAVNSFSVAMACTEQRDTKYFLLLDSCARGPKMYRAVSRGVLWCMHSVSMKNSIQFYTII